MNAAHYTSDGALHPRRHAPTLQAGSACREQGDGGRAARVPPAPTESVRGRWCAYTCASASDWPLVAMLQAPPRSGDCTRWPETVTRRSRRHQPRDSIVCNDTDGAAQAAAGVTRPVGKLSRGRASVLCTTQPSLPPHPCSVKTVVSKLWHSPAQAFTGAFVGSIWKLPSVVKACSCAFMPLTYFGFNDTVK